MGMFKTGRDLQFLVDRPNKNGGRSGWFTLVCFGTKRHFRNKGDCRHTEAILAAMQPRWRKRTRVDGFGGPVSRDEVAT